MYTRSNALTISDRLWANQQILRDLALIVGFSLFTALGAQIAIYLPFSPVPITVQTLAVLMAGAVLGSRRGAMSQLAYIAQGAIGLPVFANGAFGPAYILGPTGGYLFGFVIAAFAVGKLAELRWDRHYLTMAVAMIIGCLCYYFSGVAWLLIFTGGDLFAAVQLGVFPFVIGDTLKVIAAIVTLPSAWMLLRR